MKTKSEWTGGKLKELDPTFTLSVANIEDFKIGERIVLRQCCGSTIYEVVDKDVLNRLLKCKIYKLSIIERIKRWFK